MAAHAEYSLRCTSITQIFDFPFAISTTKTSGTKGLVARKDREVFDLVAARSAAVRAVIANEGAIAEEQKVRIGVEERVARVTSEAVEMPSVPS